MARYYDKYNSVDQLLLNLERLRDLRTFKAELPEKFLEIEQDLKHRIAKLARETANWKTYP